MKAIIILRDREETTHNPSTSTHLWGLTILERALYTLNLAGVDTFSILCGSGYGAIQCYLEGRRLGTRFKISLLKDISEVEHDQEPLLAIGGELIFDDASIRQLMAAATMPTVSIDSTPRYATGPTFTPGGFTGMALCSGRDLPVVLDEVKFGTLPPRQIGNGLEVGMCDLKGGFWYSVPHARNTRIAEDLLFEKNLTYQESENVLQGVVRRFPAKLLTRVLVNTRATANHITLLGFAVYLAAAVLFSVGSRWLDVVAGFLPVAGTVIDHTDGMVARLKFQTSRYGAWLEHVLDLLAFSLIVLGITYGLYQRRPETLVWAGGLSLLLFFNLRSFATNSYYEIFGQELSSIFSTASGLGGRLLKRVYDLGTVLAKPYLWILAGAVFNALVWSLWVLAASMGLSLLAVLLRGLSRQARST